MVGNVQSLHVFSSFLVPLRGGGAASNFKVGIAPFCSYQQLSYDVAFCVLLAFDISDGNWRGYKVPCRLSSD